MSYSGIERDTFINTQNELDQRKLNYDMLEGLHKKFSEQCDVCNGRFRKIENNKRKNALLAAASGFAGGFTAVLAKMTFWK